MPTRAPLKQKHLDWLEFEGEITQLVSNTHIEEAVIWCAETLAPISHWRTSFLFRATLDNVHAVSFDMMLPRYHKHNKEKTNSLGSLKVTTFNTASNPVTTRPRDKFSAPFLDQNITVSSLLRAVQDNGLQFYQFECGSGCLCWNLELLRVLVEFGWVKPNSQQKLEAQIDDWRSKHPHQKNKIPRPFCKGKFVQGPMLVPIPVLSLECHP